LGTLLAPYLLPIIYADLEGLGEALGLLSAAISRPIFAGPTIIFGKGVS
jgi:hypothetical protein